MKFLPTKFNTVFIVEPRTFQDIRGGFVKIYQHSNFLSIGMHGQFIESYYSISHKNVIRGMHFQTPPAEHTKLVYVTQGKILDAVVDIRKKSPTYGQHITTELSAENRHAIFIPPGFAHGFLSLEDGSCVIYAQTSEYSQEHDLGINALSCGIPWNVNDPILSERDNAFPALKDFQSAFKFKE